MRNDYQEETAQLKKRFVFIYIGTIVLLAAIFGAVLYYNSPSREPVFTDLLTEQAENNALLNQDQALHEGLMNLDQLDMNYSKMLMDAADPNSLDSLNNLISLAEKDFGNQIDRMYAGRNSFTIPSNAVKSDSTIHAFLSALNYRKGNNSLRMAFLGDNESLAGDTLAVLKLQVAVQNKEDSIRNLLQEMKYQNQFSSTAFKSPTITTGPDTDLYELQRDVRIQQDSLNNIVNLYNAATKANKNLTTQLNKLQAGANSSNALAEVMPEKINSLNQQIDDLNAELALSHIDCNLTRANGKDIIYNSRQRKDLLEESLRSLKNLSASDNPTIQRKVKDKMQLLQNIATTVRD